MLRAGVTDGGGGKSAWPWPRPRRSLRLRSHRSALCRRRGAQPPAAARGKGVDQGGLSSIVRRKEEYRTSPRRVLRRAHAMHASCPETPGRGPATGRHVMQNGVLCAALRPPPRSPVPGDGPRQSARRERRAKSSNTCRDGPCDAEIHARNQQSATAEALVWSQARPRGRR